MNEVGTDFEDETFQGIRVRVTGTEGFHLVGSFFEEGFEVIVPATKDGDSGSIEGCRLGARDLPQLSRLYDV